MIVDWLPNLAAGWGVQFLGAMSPGPSVALILSVAATRGRGPAVATCLGIACGSVILSTAALIGLATVLAQAAWGMLVVKLAGAAYLTWLAWGALRRAAVPPAPPTPSAASTPSAAGRSAALAGLTMQITNPKAIMYWLSAAALAGLGGAPWTVIGLFVAGAWMISFASHASWALALSSRPFLALYTVGRRWVDATLGAFFLFTAVKLATARI